MTATPPRCHPLKANHRLPSHVFDLVLYIHIYLSSVSYCTLLPEALVDGVGNMGFMMSRFKRQTIFLCPLSYSLLGFHLNVYSGFSYRRSPAFLPASSKVLPELFLASILKRHI
jgi:hypothetical protein